MMVESNSPMLMATANAAPATTPVQTSGSSMSTSARVLVAPSERADSTSRPSSRAKSGATFRVTKGYAPTAWAATMASAPVTRIRVPNTSTPNTSPRSRPRPTTMPETANGAIESTSMRPRPRYRRVVRTAIVTPIGTATTSVPAAKPSEFRMAGRGLT